MSGTFETGDEVRLKSGVINMTITELSADKKTAICLYEEKGLMKKESIPVVALTKEPIQRSFRVTR